MQRLCMYGGTTRIGLMDRGMRARDGCGAMLLLLLSGLQPRRTVLSALTVAVGLCRPEEWPLLFGSPREAFTIRRFWGRAWHQIMRRYVSVHGKYLAHKVLHLTPGKNPSAYVQLYTAFFISALIHYGGETFAFQHFGGGAFTFFMLQAVAITFEDFLLHLARQTPLNRFSGTSIARRLGYVWTLSWFALSLPIWQEPLRRSALMENGMAVSLISVLMGGEWNLKPMQT